MLRAIVSAGRVILKRASLARGSATTQRLLSRLLLVLFLAKQEKYIRTWYSSKKHPCFCVEAGAAKSFFNDYRSTPRNFFARTPTMKDMTATLTLMVAISRKRDLKGSSWATEV